MPRRSGLVRQGVARLRAGQWLGLLDTCRSIDRAIKGLEPSQPWLLLEELVLAIGGNPSPRRPIR
jgi:DNA polymerase III delta subunit